MGWNNEYMLFCPQCGTVIRPDRGFYFCRRCGASLMQSKIYKMSESISGINLQKYSMSELKKIYKNQFEKETLPLGKFNKSLPCAYERYCFLYDLPVPPDCEVIKPTNSKYSIEKNTATSSTSDSLDAPALLGIITAYALFSKKK